MRRTKEEAQRTREELLDAALEVFGSKGYQATTLDDIGRLAGVTRGAIYWHFGGKTQLFDTLVRERFSRISRLLSEAFTAGGTPLERLRRVLVYTLEVAQNDPEYRAILELSWYQSDVPEVQDGVKERHDAMWAFLDTLTGLVRAGIRRGEITREVDPQTTAFAAVSYVNGITGMWLSSPESIDIGKEAETLVDLFLEGIARPVRETA